MCYLPLLDMNTASLRIQIESLLEKWGVAESYIPYLSTTGLFFGVLILSGLAFFITRHVIIRIIKRIIHKTTVTWDDIFVSKKVFEPLAYIVPAIIIGGTAPHIFQEFPGLIPYVEDLVSIIVILTLMVVISSILSAIETIILSFSEYKDKPIASFIQLGKIINYIVSGMLVLSILLGKEALSLFGAVGALTAVLLLIFRDTLLGLVASIQMAGNDMIRVGDWVEMHDYGADGTVMNINLTTVKIRNFDNTITTVPTYAFISHSFKNWRGMSETGARRIKRHVWIKQTSIRYADKELLEKLQRIPMMQEVIVSINEKQFNEESISDKKWTTFGLYRHYLVAYLKKHPKLNNDFTTMVRQLQPTEKGVPLEIYCFADTTQWVEYETIQSYVMDHVLAAAPVFDLEVAQTPTTKDMEGKALLAGIGQE